MDKAKWSEIGAFGITLVGLGMIDTKIPLTILAVTAIIVVGNHPGALTSIFGVKG